MSGIQHITNPIDPSVLTTQQLIREISGLREIIEARLDGNDKAIALLQTATDRQPEIIDKAVRRLQELHQEKFQSIQTQFTERDTRTDQTSKDSKVAVDAALQAAKEAVGEQNKSSALAIAKSEASTTKQIDQIGVLINTTSKATDEKINDIKGRLDRGEGISTGTKETVKEHKDDSKSYMAIVVSVASFIFAVFIGVAHLIKP
jgi:cation transport regulator ChaB